MLKKIYLLPLLTALLVLAAGQAGAAPKYFPDADAAAKIRAATQAITLKAQIGYDPQHGGYYLRDNPKYNFGTKEILNQNYKILKKLARSGKTVTVQGRVNPMSLAATHVFIERLDGSRYHGTHAPLVKLP